MKKMRLLLAILFCVILPGLLHAQTFIEAQKKVRKSVVLIFCKDLDGKISTGTGFFISKDGLILTNAHVVKGAIDIRILSEELGTEKRANIISMLWDEKSNIGDIAILKVSGGNYTPLKLGDTTNFSSASNTGIEIGVLGYPRITDLMQFGSVSMSGNVGRITAVQGSGDQKVIQHDAATNPGNSGGPLFDMDGAVIGIVNAKLKSAEGINFAINIQAAKKLIAALDMDQHIDVRNEKVFSEFLKNVAAKVDGTTLAISTRPTKAVCLIKDTQYVNASPFKINLYPKDYTIIVMKDGYQQEERIITVKPNTDNAFTIDLVSKGGSGGTAAVTTDQGITKLYQNYLPAQNGTLNVTCDLPSDVYYIHIDAFTKVIQETTKNSSLTKTKIKENIQNWIHKRGDEKGWKALYALCATGNKTPFSFSVPSGEYVVWTQNQYLTSSRTGIYVNPDKTTDVYFDHAPRKITVKTNIEDVSIKFGNVYKGVTKVLEGKSDPAALEFVVYGGMKADTVYANKEGYKQGTASFSTLDKKDIAITITLEKDPTFKRTSEKGNFAASVLVNGNELFQDLYKVGFGGSFFKLGGSGEKLRLRGYVGIDAFISFTGKGDHIPSYMDSGSLFFTYLALGGGLYLPLGRFSLYAGVAYNIAGMYESITFSDGEKQGNLGYSLLGGEINALLQVMATKQIGISVFYKYHYNPNILQASSLDREPVNLGGHSIGAGIRY